MMYDHEFKGASIEKVTWRQIRERVAKVNPEFCAVVDDIDPPDSEPLYLAKYPYGVVIDDGVFKFPNLETGEILPLSSEKIHSDLKRDFSYTGSSTPIGMVMDKVIENFTIIDKKVCPWALYRPGKFFALKGRLDPQQSFHPTQLLQMSSGARSVYILPKIGDRSGLNKLQRGLKRKVLMPNGMSDQWDLFRNLNCLDTSADQWSSSILLFPNSWFSKIKNDSEWVHIYLYLFKEGWRHAEFDRNHRFYNVAYSRAQKNKNLKPNPYLVDLAKHIFMIMSRGIPGFKVATDDSAAPISYLKGIFINEHGLRGYYPHFFVPEYFSLSDKSTPIYFSMQYPTSLEFSPKSRKESSILSDLWELKDIIKNFEDEMSVGRTGIEGTNMERLFNATTISYFHNQDDYRNEIMKTERLISMDKNFTQNDFVSKSFSSSGPFIRGCIQISPKN